MNLVRVGFLTMLLLASSAFAQDAPKGYDLGECSTSGFIAMHLSVVDKDLKMDRVSTGPGESKKFDGPLYKFVSEDDKGKHYVYVDKDGDKLQLTMPEKGNARFDVNGKDPDVVFVMRDDDGSKLADNALEEYHSCQDFMDHSAPSALMNLDKS